MRFYGFGCAPQAKKDGYAGAVKLAYGSPTEIAEKYHADDVAVVYGAAVRGKINHFEFGIIAK